MEKRSESFPGNIFANWHIQVVIQILTVHRTVRNTVNSRFPLVMYSYLKYS